MQAGHEGLAKIGETRPDKDILTAFSTCSDSKYSLSKAVSKEAVCSLVVTLQALPGFFTVHASPALPWH
jgi:hypothetical protein